MWVEKCWRQLDQLLGWRDHEKCNCVNVATLAPSTLPALQISIHCALQGGKMNIILPRILYFVKRGKYNVLKHFAINCQYVSNVIQFSVFGI